MKKVVFFTLLFLLYNGILAQTPLINYPSLNHDGSKMAFNYQGDIWVSNVDGSEIKRITVHEAYDTSPIWSSDGTQIVFQSNRFGNDDVYVMPAKGGKPKRLTYHSASDRATYFGSDDLLLFQTVRNFSQVERETEIHTITTAGGTPKLMLSSLGSDAIMSPNQKFIAFVRGTCRIEREAYQGAANRDIWVYNIERDSYNRITDYAGNDYAPQWRGDGSLLYLSSKSGRYNIHEIAILETGKKGGEENQVTSFSDMGIFSFSISRDAQKVILNKGDELYLLDADSHQLSSVELTFDTDIVFDEIVRTNYSGEIKEVSPSPDGKLSALVIRGEIYVTENSEEKSKTVNLSKSSYRDRMPVWLNDNSLVFVSDRDGQNDLYLISSNDPEEKNIFKSLKRKVSRLTKTEEGETHPIISPDGKKIAFKRGGSKLVVAQITSTGSLSDEKVLLNGWDSPSGISWSPDSNWISYSLSDLYFNEEVYVQKVDGSIDPVNVSMHPKTDRSPVWSEDGSKIGFSSNRNNSDYDAWFVWLKIEDWQKTEEDWEEEDKGASKKKSDKSETANLSNKKNVSSDKEKKESFRIDLKEMHKRQVQVTNFSGGEFIKGFSKDGETVYYTTGNGTWGNSKVEADLFEIKWDGKDKKALTKKDAAPKSVVMSKDKDVIFYTSKGKLKKLKLESEQGEIESLPVKAVLDINYLDEADQIFQEAWTAIREGFYDPDFHGRNWDELKTQYQPLAMKASTRDDFKSMFNRMLGQINASHMGMYRGENRAKLQKQTTGLLGLRIEPLKTGGVEVVDLIDLMPAKREVSRLNKGDIILAVNGTSLTASVNFYSLMNNQGNEKIYLQVRNSDGSEREIVIRPQESDRKEKYLDWVNQRKKLTDEYSEGKLGYIHIQGMNWTSFEEFERELTAEGLGKEGVVIDVRYNGGGWTTDYLMAVLTVRQHAYTIPRGAAKDLELQHPDFSRYYPYSERLPLAAWTKPTIALCNERSYSNAEIFSHAYKNLGLGTLVGQPTFGAVISTGSHTLIDGSYVRMPFRGWYVKNTGDNMDFVPAIPDILVENDPDGKSKGQDKQLKRAVDELLKQISN